MANSMLCRLGGTNIGFVCFIILNVTLWISGAAAITNSGNKSNTSKESIERTFSQENEKPLQLNQDEVYKSSRYTRRPSGDNKNKDWITLKGDRDAVASSSGNYDRKYGYYATTDESGYGYQDSEHGNGAFFGGQGSSGPSGDRDAGLYHYQPFYHGYDHRDYGPHYQGGYGGHHHGPESHALSLKGLILPLAGVALLGAAAALVSNPVLLQLGVISGRRKRRSIANDLFSTNSNQERDLENVDSIVTLLSRFKKSIADSDEDLVKNRWKVNPKDEEDFSKSPLKKFSKLMNNIPGGDIDAYQMPGIDEDIKLNEKTIDLNSPHGSKKASRYHKSFGDKGIVTKKYIGIKKT